MPDNRNYPNPEEMSIDALLEETRMQIEADPGKAGTMLDHVAQQQEEQIIQEPTPTAQEEDFTPNFGDAFADYGTYEEPPADAPMPENFEAPYEEDTDYEASEPRHKRSKKPKRKTGKRIVPLFVKVLLYLVIVGVIAVGLGYGAWDCAKDVLGFGRAQEEVSFVVYENDTIEDIAKRLEKQGIIKYPWLFQFYCGLTDSDENIVPGEHKLYYNYDYNAMLDKMSPVAKREIVSDLTIPEGFTVAQIFKLFEEKNVCTVAELEECSANHEFDYWFLEGIPYGKANRLEGFLFPDTYDFYKNDDPVRVLNKLLSTFDEKFGDGHKQRLDELNEMLAQRWRNAGYGEEYIRDHRFTPYQLMTVASMIEKESGAVSESADIASVIYNRLCNPANYPYLNIDATGMYDNFAMAVTDGSVDNPYDTYAVKGLPAGPICNPSMNSISAALTPTDTNYYYYALDMTTHLHHFSKTKEEHDEFVKGQNYGG